jgi:hypothetical protein
MESSYIVSRRRALDLFGAQRETFYIKIRSFDRRSISKFYLLIAQNTTYSYKLHFMQEF